MNLAKTYDEILHHDRNGLTFSSLYIRENVCNSNLILDIVPSPTYLNLSVELFRFFIVVLHWFFDL